MTDDEANNAYTLGFKDGQYYAERKSLATVHGSTQRMQNDLAHAQLQFNKCRESAVNATLAGDGFYEHNEASYWKGRRDALRNLKSNTEDTRASSR